MSASRGRPRRGTAAIVLMTVAVSTAGAASAPAPTFAQLAGVTPPLQEDGRSLVPLLDGGPVDWRTDILLELPGQTGPMPMWWAVRTRHYLSVELQTGERELYDLTGRREPPDPFELQNVAGQPTYADVQSRLAARLQQLRL
jgi:arylsulfatase A-like enzyme